MGMHVMLDGVYCYQWIIHCLVAGVRRYNVSIFAYGQTGSGKTHTMFGPSGAMQASLGDQCVDMR